jgi:hypothetical protein
MTELPSGCRWRRPTLDDAEAIHGFVARRNTALVGFADITLDEVRDDRIPASIRPSTLG